MNDTYSVHSGQPLIRNIYFFSNFDFDHFDLKKNVNHNNYVKMKGTLDLQDTSPDFQNNNKNYQCFDLRNEISSAQFSLFYFKFRSFPSNASRMSTGTVML